MLAERMSISVARCYLGLSVLSYVVQRIKIRHMANIIKKLQNGFELRPLDSFDQSEVRRVATRVFFNIAGEWGLSRSESLTLLGGPSERTFYRWRDGNVSALPRDTLERISVMLGIYKATHILLPVAERANEWLRRTNTDFGDKSALNVMLNGRVDDLYQIRRYLDGWCS